MTPKNLRRLILGITLVWLAAGLVLAGLMLGGLLGKDRFEILFAGGFVGYALVVTFLYKVLTDHSRG